MSSSLTLRGAHLQAEAADLQASQRPAAGTLGLSSQHVAGVVEALYRAASAYNQAAVQPQLATATSPRRGSLQPQVCLHSQNSVAVDKAKLCVCHPSFCIVL